jgi:hypothetical protein
LSSGVIEDGACRRLERVEARKIYAGDVVRVIIIFKEVKGRRIYCI